MFISPFPALFLTALFCLSVWSIWACNVLQNEVTFPHVSTSPKLVPHSSRREPHRPDERQRQPRRRERGALQACQPADHQRGERGEHSASRREDRGGALPRELALQVSQHKEEEEVPHPVLPEEEQKERKDGGLRADRQQGLGRLERGGGWRQPPFLSNVRVFVLSRFSKPFVFFRFIWFFFKQKFLFKRKKNGLHKEMNWFVMQQKNTSMFLRRFLNTLVQKWRLQQMWGDLGFVCLVQCS